MSDTAAPSVLPLRLMRAIAVVASEGGAAAAAAALHLSPSALTRAVQQAEQQLGVQLFERGARGMSCTPAGQLLAPRAQRALAELQQAQDELAALGHGGGATLGRSLVDSGAQALLEVARHRSEGAAARALGVSQPALNQALRKLEHAARTRVFERSRQGSRLTAAGELLLRRVKLAQAEWRIGHEDIGRFTGKAAARVAIGALPMASDVLVPQALARLLEQQPGVVATVADGTYEALLHQLRHGELDLMVGPLRGPQAAADVDEQALFVDRLVAVVGTQHPLLQRSRRPSLATLTRWPWIAPLPDTPAMAAFERSFTAAGRPLPPIELHANSPAVVHAMLRAGKHVALLSPLQIRAEVEAGVLTPLPLPLAGTERSIGLTLRRDGMSSQTALALIDALREVAAQAVAVGPWTRRHRSPTHRT